MDKYDNIIKSADRKIKKIDNEILKEKIKFTKAGKDITLMLEDFLLSDEQLAKIQHYFDKYGESLSSFIPTLFNRLVDIYLYEKEFDSCVRHSVIKLIETVIVNDDFNYFNDDDVLDRFLKFSSVENDDIDIIAISNFLLRKDYVMKSICKALESSKVDSITKRVYKFCEYYEELGYEIKDNKVFVYRHD